MCQICSKFTIKIPERRLCYPKKLPVESLQYKHQARFEIYSKLTIKTLERSQ